jgi:hypothetical protein
MSVEIEQIEQVESDTFDSENITDIFSYLLPSAEIQKDQKIFGLLFNRNVFNGWVKQPSACCAAASLAGAWNALLNLGRNDTELGALGHEDILVIYREIFLDIIKRRTSSFERLLGAKFFPLFDLIEKELFKIGKVIGGKKSDGANKTMINNIVRGLAREYFLKNQSNNPSDHIDSIDKDIVEPYSQKNPLDIIVELFKDDGDQLLDCDKNNNTDDENNAPNQNPKKWDEMVEEDSSVKNIHR